jgi:hypothetical protein
MNDQRANRKGGGSIVPRYRLTTALVIITVVAVWLSTFSMEEAGRNVRHGIMLGILLVAMFAALFGQGRRRAFWIGFFVVMVLASLNNTIRGHFVYLGVFKLAENLAQMASPQSAIGAGIYATIREGLNLMLAGLVGLFAVYIYNRNHEQE